MTIQAPQRSQTHGVTGVAQSLAAGLFSAMTFGFRGTFILLIHAYRTSLSPFLANACRYTPSCSAYALTAFQQHTPWRALLLMLHRIGRCHPWGGSGFDPVPPAQKPHAAPDRCRHAAPSLTAISTNSAPRPAGPRQHG